MSEHPRLLYHCWLSPLSRRVILQLEEKKLEYSLQIEKIWEQRAEFYHLNASGAVPVFRDIDGAVIADVYPVSEYLEDIYPTPSLLGRNRVDRAEVRRLISWFEEKFNQEVTKNLLYEKLYKRLFKRGNPNSNALRAGSINIHYHLEYIGYLVERRNWLAGDSLSLADLSAGAHLSALDYLGNVPWEQHQGAKEWYSRLKSRPSFRPLLSERMPSIQPASHYADLDF